MLLRTVFDTVEKIGTMLPLQDKEFAGHKIPETSRTLQGH